MYRSEPAGNWFLNNQSLILLIGGALLAVLLAVNFLCSDSPDRARVLRLSGVVAIKRGNETIRPVVGMMLNAQDKVITGDDAFLEVAYDDGLKNVMKINSNSRVVFESSRIERYTRLFMDRGSVMVKLDGLEKGSTFKVRTPVAIAGVRGTAFGIELNGKEAVITDYESRIFVKGLTPDFLEMNDELLMSNGWKVQVAQFEKPSRMVKLEGWENSAWRSWLSSIDELPKTSRVSGLTDFKEVVMQRPMELFMAAVSRLSLSVPTLALMLFGVLALGTGKVVERVWS
ncbi:MAG: FecR domain-containing protein [Candidatus Omnitrophica bacterium]|nr:FecR domain-containing protein [Candidatus Omnitrophota bacterium]